jgi:acyl-CoA synthetase (AMP-forming)/AMP-acid ligase II
MNLFDAIFQHQRESPAIIYEGRRISYADLAERTQTMAAAIAAVGTQRGDRVALLLNDSPEFVEAFIAICSMEAIAVPINPALPLKDQRTIIHNCRARVAIIEDEFRETLVTNAPEELHFPEELVTRRPHAAANSFRRCR